MHGLEGSSRNWTDLMDLLRPALACEALDLPGFGDSPPRPDGRYSIAALAQTVIALIEKQKRGPVHLIGNSLGGAVCVKVAATRPELIRTLTLISPALPDCAAPDGPAALPRDRASRGSATWLFRQVQAHAARTPRRRRHRHLLQRSQAVRAGPVRRRGRRTDPPGLPRLRRRRAGGQRPPLTAEFLREGRRSAWRDAARITAPSLVIYGSHDRVVDPRNAGRAAHAFKNAKIVVLPRTGHVAQMERPGLVAAEIGILLAASPPGRHQAARAGPGNSRSLPPVDRGTGGGR